MSSTSHIDANEQITLQVGTERFVTTAGTLASKSKFFQKLLSPPWARPREDGSYFLDADPMLFGHILQYLRRERFPIFYDDDKGHDTAIYVALQREADFYLLTSLSEWLKEKKYLKVIELKYTIEELDGVVSGHIQADSRFQFFPKWSTEKVYKCPKGNILHDGYPKRCGVLCQKLRRELGVQWSERKIFAGVIITWETVVNEDLCVDTS